MFENIEKLPMIPLRGLSVFPSMILNFDIERPISIAALDRAMEADRRIFLLAQRDADVDGQSHQAALSKQRSCGNL